MLSWIFTFFVPARVAGMLGFRAVRGRTPV